MSGEKPSNDIQRRKVLKSTAALGIGALTLTSSAVAESDDVPGDLRVTDTSELSGGRAKREIANLNGSQPIRNLEETIKQETALGDRDSIVVEITTNDETVNESDPVVVISGYGPEEEHEESAAILLSIIADTDENGNRREPVAAFGLSAKSGGEVSASHDGQSVSVRSYGYDDNGNAKVLDEKISEIDNEVSTQSFHDALGCGACTAIVSELCDKGTGSVSRTACLKACAPFLGSVWGYGACGAACIVIVDTINDYGCAVGAGAICAAVGVCSG